MSNWDDKRLEAIHDAIVVADGSERGPLSFAFAEFLESRAWLKSEGARWSALNAVLTAEGGPLGARVRELEADRDFLVMTLANVWEVPKESVMAFVAGRHGAAAQEGGTDGL